MNSALLSSGAATAPSKNHETLTDSDYDGDSENELNQNDYGLESVVLIDPIVSHASDFCNTPTGSIISLNSSENENDLVLVGTPSISEESESEGIEFIFPTMRVTSMALGSGAENHGGEMSKETELEVEMATIQITPGTPTASTSPLPDHSEVFEGSPPMQEPKLFRQQIPTASPIEIAPLTLEITTEHYPKLQAEPIPEKEIEALNPHIQALKNLLSMDKKETFASILHILKEYIQAHPYLSALQVASILLTLFPATAFPALFWALGFGRAGPIAGTFATTWQASLVGGATAGSYFSAFQSVAMGGVKGLMMVQNVVRSGAVATAVGTALGNAVGWKSGPDEGRTSQETVNGNVGEKGGRSGTG